MMVEIVKIIFHNDEELAEKLNSIEQKGLDKMDILSYAEGRRGPFGTYNSMKILLRYKNERIKLNK